MTLKIERDSDGRRIVIYLSVRLRSEHLDELTAQLTGEQCVCGVGRRGCNAFIVEPNHELLVRTLLEAGDLHPVVDAVLPLTQASMAYTEEVQRRSSLWLTARIYASLSTNHAPDVIAAVSVTPYTIRPKAKSGP